MGFKYNQDSNILEDVHKPVKELLPMVDPCDFIVNGWDISGKNLYEACKRAHVLEPDLIEQLKDDLSSIVPLKAAFNGEFIAAN
jgi:myo-inositol-1-phosphate synthase